MNDRLPEHLDPAPEYTVQESEYARLLGYPRAQPIEGRARELADGAARWFAGRGGTWWYARQVERLALEEGGRVTLDDASFSCRVLHDRLREAGAESAVLVAVSAGPESEEEARRLWEEGKPDEYFFLESYGSAVVEALVAAASFRLCQWADQHRLAVLPHYSPGYPGWDIAEQPRLLDLMLRGCRRPWPGPLRSLDTGMLSPKKALLGVFGITPHVERVRRLTTLVPCHSCSLPGCRYRRAPYRDPRPQMEPERHSVPPSAPPSYRFNTRALQRWAEERLRLERAADGSVEARFLYEGTTCSNLGQPLAFEYHITLRPGKAGYTIAAARCAPAPGDTGHTFMCEYRADPEGLLARIADDHPLVGRPLDDVLHWPRPDDASGCYCAEPGRQRKWALALEVLHFALARDPLGTESA